MHTNSFHTNSATTRGEYAFRTEARCCSANKDFTKPATPAAPSKWPMLVFTLWRGGGGGEGRRGGAAGGKEGYLFLDFVCFLFGFFFVFAGGFWLLVAFGFWLLFLCWLLVAFGFWLLFLCWPLVASLGFWLLCFFWLPLLQSGAARKEGRKEGRKEACPWF